LPLGNLGNPGLPNAYASVARTLPSGFARRRSAAAAVVGAGDHEAAGIFTSPGNAPPYNAFFATQTAYEGTQRPFPYPPGASGDEFIFAPTTYLGYGNCLENSTYYHSTATAQTAHFSVYDFCASPPAFIFDTPVDARFLSNYVRIGSDGLPSYTVETFTKDSVPAATSTWYTVLYNYASARYDLIISAPAVTFSATAGGWSVVELYGAPGPCPIVAPSGASNIAYHDTAQRAWVALQPAMGSVTSYVGLGSGTPSSNPCFLASGATPAALQFSLLKQNWSWKVTSP
jgi:hypothetical protein